MTSAAPATEAAAAEAPVAAVIFVPSHTRAWSDDRRVAHEAYLAEREVPVETASFARIDVGSAVLIDYGRGRERCEVSLSRTKFRAHSATIDIATIVGQPVGAEFAIEDRSGKAVLVRHIDDADNGDNENEEEVDSSIPTNAELYDRNSSQALTANDIKSMKSNAPPSALVQALVENSTTFDQKTEWSQAKYIARKKRKYVTNFRALPLEPVHAVDTVRLNEPMRINHASNVQFSQLLAAANVCAGNLTLSVDATGGLLTASVAKRQGGDGFVLAPHFNALNSPLALNEKNVMSAATNVRLTDSEAQSILHFPYQIVEECHASASDAAASEDSLVNYYLDARLALHSGVDSLVFVARYDPGTLFRSLFPFLRPGACFALHCPSPAPLLALMAWLRIDSRAVKLELSNTWHREYQVLSQRTHPHVSMNQDNGTILSGMKTHIAI